MLDHYKTEVGMGAERHIIKKIGAFVGTDVPIVHKAAEELEINAAPWVARKEFD